ncbi:MAG TPA: glycoside hydrolase family 2, partial [Armatimonadota bacterium]|nr:glycoside hydrolase family 2 [Armatimonadota bacterium]
IEAGSTAVFLCAEAFREGDDPVRWMPLSPKGAVVGLASWLYHKDEWAKAHPIFEGLPAGGLMDYEVYAELIPDVGFNGQPLPTEAVAGGCNASQDYSSGLFVAVYPLGKGRVILNSLRVRETLGGEPVAERLLRNMLRYAAGKTGE